MSIHKNAPHTHSQANGDNLYGDISPQHILECSEVEQLNYLDTLSALHKHQLGLERQRLR